MTEATSEEPQLVSAPPSETLKISDWKLSLLGGELLTKLMPSVMNAIVQALPPAERLDETLRANITGALVDGRIQVWGILGLDEEKTWRPVGFITTSLRMDDMTGKNTLLVYTMFSYAVIEDKAYKLFVDTLRSYAETQNCGKMVCYTNNARIIRMLRGLGWNTDFVFAHMNLESDHG